MTVRSPGALQSVATPMVRDMAGKRIVDLAMVFVTPTFSGDHRAHRGHRDALSPVNPGPKNSRGRRYVRTGQINAPRQAA